jgi:hypothetical protein
MGAVDFNTAVLRRLVLPLDTFGFWSDNEKTTFEALEELVILQPDYTGLDKRKREPPEVDRREMNYLHDGN